MNRQLENISKVWPTIKAVFSVHIPNFCLNFNQLWSDPENMSFPATNDDYVSVMV